MRWESHRSTHRTHFCRYLPLDTSATSTSTPASESPTTPLPTPTSTQGNNDPSSPPGDSGSTSQSSPSPQSRPAHSSAFPIAATVGIAVSCVAVVALCILISLTIRTSRRRAARSQTADATSLNSARTTPWTQHVQPYLLKANPPGDRLKQRCHDDSPPHYNESPSPTNPTTRKDWLFSAGYRPRSSAPVIEGSAYSLGH